MDLQWQRQTELWLRLMGESAIPAALRLSLRQGQDMFYLESLDGRALLSLSRPLPEARRRPALLRLLALLQPEAGDGIPLRAWLARGCVWLAATMPRDSGAEQWARMSRQQRRLLDRVAEGSHEAQ
ncbi:hypothetical protein [Chromobacterium vaccinii]|uniref:hypothetical protein n=1 Tax=Chromobacterium vaccinii TaxID=1108595 RepID=UPI001E3C08EF|nr:hypothetical protein [Chromobacterium vaccinii]MCD4500977.1 hypothetical protein [Chromobacterium vaccinii]